MWTRSELKTNAKSVLRRTYWLSFALCIVYGILAGVSSSAASMQSYAASFEINLAYGVVLTVGLFSLAYGIFIANPLEVGINDFFMTAREFDVSFGKLFSVFSKNYLNVVKTLFLRNLFITLWTFFFIIPGLIKTYEYFFIPYILAENPDISSDRAFELSRAMTKGKKFDIFVLQLSFMGWTLLGMLACCVGLWFVNPYIMATNAELYAAQRSQVLASGEAQEYELCGFYNE